LSGFEGWFGFWPIDRSLFTDREQNGGEATDDAIFLEREAALADAVPRQGAFHLLKQLAEAAKRRSMPKRHLNAFQGGFFLALLLISDGHSMVIELRQRFWGAGRLAARGRAFPASLVCSRGHDDHGRMKGEVFDLDPELLRYVEKISEEPTFSPGPEKGASACYHRGAACRKRFAAGCDLDLDVLELFFEEPLAFAGVRGFPMQGGNQGPMDGGEDEAEQQDRDHDGKSEMFHGRSPFTVKVNPPGDRGAVCTW
jgi:hypothetical protein